jgi:hypothetical protein
VSIVWQSIYNIGYYDRLQNQLALWENEAQITRSL